MLLSRCYDAARRNAGEDPGFPCRPLSVDGWNGMNSNSCAVNGCGVVSFRAVSTPAEATRNHYCCSAWSHSCARRINWPEMPPRRGINPQRPTRCRQARISLTIPPSGHWVIIRHRHLHAGRSRRSGALIAYRPTQNRRPAIACPGDAAKSMPDVAKSERRTSRNSSGSIDCRNQHPGFAVPADERRHVC